jgi:hypothetical protein
LQLSGQSRVELDGDDALRALGQRQRERTLAGADLQEGLVGARVDEPDQPLDRRRPEEVLAEAPSHLGRLCPE